MPFSGVDTAGSVVSLPEALLDVYSMDIEHEALGVTRFAEFAVRKTELSALPGESITFTRYSNLTLGGVLTESVDMTLDTLAAAQHSISVTEYGKAIGVSEKLLQLSFDDVLSEAAVLLGRDYAVVLDTQIRDTLINNLTQEVFAGDATMASQLDAGDVYDTEVIRDAVETLQTQNAPKFNSDFYIGFVHPHQAAHLKRDPDWVAAQNYAGTRALFNGEIGRWEDVVFIATTHMPNGAASASDPGYKLSLVGAGADASNLYEGLIFGDACVGWAEALPVEMRESGVIDFGRKHGLAWYSIMGFGLLYDNYGVKITTA